jgi:hypothetical protein
MPTVRDIITRAHRKIRVTAPDEPMQAEFAAEALDNLNDMLHEWKLRGIDLNHGDMLMDDTFPLPDEYRAGVVHMLGMYMSPNYNRPPNFDADDFLRRIQADTLVIDDIEFEDALTELPSSRRYYFSAR